MNAIGARDRTAATLSGTNPAAHIRGKSKGAVALPSEDMLHAQIVQYALLTLPKSAVIHHSPNEGKRGWKAQRWLKQSCVQPGWPDLQFIYMGATMFMEVKSAKGKLSPAQIAMHERLDDAGFPVVVVRSLDEAVKEIKAFIKDAWRE